MKYSLGILLLLSCYVQAKTQGNIRLGIEQHKQDKSSTDIAIGGMLKYESEKFYGTNLGVGFYSVNALNKHNNNGVPFYSTQNRNYQLLGEAYIQANLQNTYLTLGRQVLDTPFLDSDDIGMIPDLYEAYTLRNSDLKDTTITLSYVTKMAGIDASMPEHFSKINGNDALEMLGIVYEGIQNISLQTWYYHIKNQAEIIYLEAGYEGSNEEVKYAFGAQYAIQNHKENKKAKITGLSAEIGHPQSGLDFTFAYNKTDSTNDQEAENFYGAGPFFTCSEHLTLADAGSDGDVLFASLSYDATKIGIEGLSFMISNSHLKGKNVKMHEMDLLANYALKDNLSIDVIYSDIDDKVNKKESFKNTRVFVNYYF